MTLELKPSSSQWIYLCTCNELLLGSAAINAHFKNNSRCVLSDSKQSDKHSLQEGVKEK